MRVKFSEILLKSPATAPSMVLPINWERALGSAALGLTRLRPGALVARSRRSREAAAAPWGVSTEVGLSPVAGLASWAKLMAAPARAREATAAAMGARWRVVRGTPFFGCVSGGEKGGPGGVRQGQRCGSAVEPGFR